MDSFTYSNICHQCQACNKEAIESIPLVKQPGQHAGRSSRWLPQCISSNFQQPRDSSIKSSKYRS